MPSKTKTAKPPVISKTTQCDTISFPEFILSILQPQTVQQNVIAMELPATDTSPPTPQWKPLTRNQRRVLGVLIEKSKTTPDVYPMSLNGIKTGANQKSNRSPQLELSEHQVEDTLYELRKLGCVVEIHTGGRIPKFKHQAYEWLAVNKSELAVMAELLLRGEQTIGELRTRAARMETSITGIEELRPILVSLIAKQLVVELTPAGRGQIVSHNLYFPDELQRLQKEFANGVFESTDDDPIDSQPAQSSSHRTVAKNEIEVSESDLESLHKRISDLESTVDGLRQQLTELRELIES